MSSEHLLPGHTDVSAWGVIFCCEMKTFSSFWDGKTWIFFPPVDWEKNTNSIFFIFISTQKWICISAWLQYKHVSCSAKSKINLALEKNKTLFMKFTEIMSVLGRCGSAFSATKEGLLQLQSIVNTWLKLTKNYRKVRSWAKYSIAAPTIQFRVDRDVTAP